MKKDTVMAIVLGVLLLVSVIQAVQLNTLKTSLNEGGVSVKTDSTTAQSGAGSGSGVSVPSSLDNLPTMVGGC
jgi:hypothetical protein